jgi:hypothetical protein
VFWASDVPRFTVGDADQPGQVLLRDRAVQPHLLPHGLHLGLGGKVAEKDAAAGD